jgi:hypothetical protein
VADEKHGSAVRDSDGVKPASVQLFVFTSRDHLPQATNAAAGKGAVLEMSTMYRRRSYRLSMNFSLPYVLDEINIDSRGRDPRSSARKLERRSLALKTLSISRLGTVPLEKPFTRHH